MKSSKYGIYNSYDNTDFFLNPLTSGKIIGTELSLI